MNTLVIGPRGDISQAAEIIKRGGLVAVPTETVYGLCCDGFNDSAVKRLFEVKGRPVDKPMSLLVTGAEHADDSCGHMTGDAHKLAEAFWPGPLTIVIAKSRLDMSLLTAGGNTVGVRCPDNALALRLICLSKTALAAPSCNPSGESSAVNADMALRYFDGVIDCVIDGGKCDIGVESTVVSATQAGIRFLRVGAISTDAIMDAL
jgi:L-threonylcarbamoyladenylate synthase